MSRLLRKFALCSKPDTQTRQSSDVECAVCQDPPTKPCTVPCGNQHVFCQACLQGLVTHRIYRNHFPCPLCRTRVRIPLGGVAAFRQGKGAGSRFLARLPIPRPRCRRGSSTDSVSTVEWPDDLSLSDFGGRGVGTLGEQAYNAVYDDDEDPDDSSSLGIPSIPGTPAFVTGRRELDSWLNSLDPEQVLILEEINRRREQGSRLGPESLDPLSQALEVLDEAVRLHGNGNGLGEAVNDDDEADRGEPSFRTAGHEDGPPTLEDVGDVATVPDMVSDGEDLDMTVVLQMIADMENDDHGDVPHDATSVETEEREAEQHEETSRSSHPAPVQERGDEAPEMRDGSPPLPPPRPHTTTQQNRSSTHENWKLRTIADTTIPRPKLSFASGERFFGPEDEEDYLERPDRGYPHFPQQVSMDGSLLDEETELPLQQRYHEMLRQNAARDTEGKWVGQTETQASTDQSVSQEPHSSEDLALTNQAETNAETSSAEHQRHDSPLSEHSQEWNPDAFSLIQADTRGRASEEDHPPRPGKPGRDLPEDLMPREERRRRGATKLSRMVAEMLADDNDLSPEVSEVVSREGPNDWVRRIRSLQHRRRGGNAKRPVSRSHSHGAKREPGGDRDGDKETERQRVGCRGNRERVDGQGDQEKDRRREKDTENWREGGQKAWEMERERARKGVEGETINKPPPSRSVHARNVTIIHI